MTAKELREAYINSLNIAFAPIGMTRVSKSIFAETRDKIIWRGIYVSFHSKWGVLNSQPSLAVFCPSAEKIVSDCLSHIYSTHKRTPFFGKMGLPVLTHPLYDLAYRQFGKDRRPYSYGASELEQIGDRVQLIRDDFALAREAFLEASSSLESLKDRLLRDWAPGARMYAIAVAYLLSSQINAGEVGRLLGSNPNPMSQEFANYFIKTRIGGTK